MGRLATADEIAAMVVYLSSDEVGGVIDWTIFYNYIYYRLHSSLGLSLKLTVDGVCKNKINQTYR